MILLNQQLGSLQYIMVITEQLPCKVLPQDGENVNH